MNFLLTDNVMLNGGDAAIIMGTLAFMHTFFPRAETRVQCDYYAKAKSLYTHFTLKQSITEASMMYPPPLFWRIPSRLRYYLWCKGLRFPNLTSHQEREALADYGWADGVISCGGSFLTDTYNIQNVLNEFKVAFEFKKPMVILGQSIGPFRSDVNLHEVSDCLKKFEVIVVRESRSYDLLLSLGINPNRLIRGRDLAFFLDEHPADNFIGLKTHPHLAVSVRRWLFPEGRDAVEAHHAYVNRMASTLDSIITRTSAKITMISTCQGTPAYAYDDSQVAEEVRSRMRFKDRVTVNSAFHTPEQFMRALETVDIFIGTRMHACILAVLRNIPIINIEYEFKSREIFKEMGLQKYVLNINEFTAEAIVRLVEEILTDKQLIRDQIGAEVARAKKDLLLVGQKVREILLDK